MASASSSAQPAATPLPNQYYQPGKTGSNGRGPVYMQTSSGNVVLVRRVHRKTETPMKQFTRWIVDHQTGLSANLFALLFLAHTIFPRLRVHTVKFFSLSYLNPSTGTYKLGKDDFFFILFLVVLFTGLRAGTMDYILAPFARSQGLCKKKGVTRFGEQAWLVIVYAVFFPMGMYLYCNSYYFWSLDKLWSQWPNREMPGLRKAYILIQLAFWLQQIFVINIEERRKDHWQMLTHHFITVTLLVLAYCYRHTAVANTTLILMDVSDFFLPLAKCQKYLGYTTICDVTFGLFMLSWFIARHIFFPMICYSVWMQSSDIIPKGCFKGAGDDPMGVLVGPDEVSFLAPFIKSFAPLSDATSSKLAFLLEPLFSADGSVCYNDLVKWTFLSMLIVLQLFIIVWFFMIVQVAIRVVRGVGADDSRSDGEDEDEDEEDEEDENEDKRRGRSGDDGDEFVYEEAQPLEEEVGVEAIDLRNWERRTGLKRPAAAATGVSLPGHSDRKELLGRIGCEKQVD